jgi:hypothetical protein
MPTPNRLQIAYGCLRAKERPSRREADWLSLKQPEPIMECQTNARTFRESWKKGKLVGQKES